MKNIHQYVNSFTSCERMLSAGCHYSCRVECSMPLFLQSCCPANLTNLLFPYEFSGGREELYFS